MPNKEIRASLFVRSGSHLYGTATDKSDEDFRGFYVPSKKDLIAAPHFNRQKLIHRYFNSETDTTIWDVNAFFDMLIKGDPQATELLFAPKENQIDCDEHGRSVIDNRSIFVSKLLNKRILGYAQSELRKVRGVTLEPLKRTINEGKIIEDIRTYFAPDKSEMDQIIDLLYLARPRKEIRRTKTLGAKRKEEIAKYGYCTSSACHSLRLTEQCIELNKTGSITFPRPNAKFLLSIKKGEVLYGHFEDVIKSRMEEINTIDESSLLRDKPQIVKAENLFYSIAFSRFGYTETQAELLFNELAETWKKETELYSSTSKSAMHPAYQRIIGMGFVAVPLIIRELKERPNWWFWALRSITGIDPVNAEDRGSLPAMTAAWIKWYGD